MRTVADLWNSFEAGILVPINAPAQQRAEMRKAFYSGCKAAFELMTLDVTQLSEDDGCAALSKIDDELEAFVIDLFGKKGNA